MSHLVCGGREEPNIDLQVGIYSNVMLIIKTTDLQANRQVQKHQAKGKQSRQKSVTGRIT